MINKIKVIFLLIIVINLIYLSPAYCASSFTLNAVQTNSGASLNAGDEFEVDIKLTSFNSIGGDLNGIGVLLTKVTFDSSIIEKVSAEGKNGFTATWGNKLLLDNVTGVNSDTVIATLKFKVKSNVPANSNVTIAFEDSKGSNGTTNIVPSTKGLSIVINPSSSPSPVPSSPSSNSPPLPNAGVAGTLFAIIAIALITSIVLVVKNYKLRDI